MRSLHAGILGLLLLPLLAESETTCSMTSPCVEGLGQGQPFQQPVQVKGTSGYLRVKIDCDVSEVQFGWLKLKRRLYNKLPVGPTWHIKKGGHVHLTLRNLMTDEGIDHGKPHNVMQKPNTTNMHTHGLHVSSDSPQDNVGIAIEPGQKYEYKYCIHDQNPSGTLWYHAHVHTSTLFQVHSGLAGMIIVEDDPDTMSALLSDASCPDNCDHDIQMVFQPLLQYKHQFVGFGIIQHEIGDDPLFMQNHITTDKNMPLSDWLSQNVNFVTTNGLVQPVLTMITGELYRFRMVNANGFDTLEVLITNKGTNTSAENCKIREISVDGVYLNRPRELHQGQSFLAPGNRVDWLIKCEHAGEYELRSYPDPKNRMSMGQISRYTGLLVTLKVEDPSPSFNFFHIPTILNHLGSIFFKRDEDTEEASEESKFLETLSPSHRNEDENGVSKESKKFFGWFEDEWDFPYDLPPRPHFMTDLRGLEESEIDQRFVMEFDTRLKLNRQSWSYPDNIRYKMTLGRVQEWHVVNTDSHDSHPLHIHVNHFQVIGFHKYTGPFSLDFRDETLYNQDDHKPCFYQQAGVNIDREHGKEVPENALRYLGHDERYAKNDGDTLAYARSGEWRDTLLIPPLSNISIRFIPERYDCLVIIHCHILAHEDMGMMMMTQIVEGDEPLTANITSGNAYPGTCRRCDRYPFNNPKTLCDEGHDKVPNSAALEPSPLHKKEFAKEEIPNFWEITETPLKNGD